ncbi:AraC family transcriptional regulator [uncultured Oscillibacter sp.]|uniref:helix-turn-helix transcriptional regulator n=1 Tax=uncultured Oscillibacter sp. TaxID=876091 RepID=UPI0028050E59|nr:AraC family transcriptional regulator [uncultured Oscillibacter sp.]
MRLLKTSRVFTKPNKTLTRLVRDLLVTVGLVTALCCMMMLYIILQKEQQSEQSRHNAVLDQITGTLDANLSAEQNALLWLLSDQEIVRCILNPEPSDTVETYHCVSTLLACADEHSGIKNLMLYPVDSGVLYSSVKGAVSVRESPEWAVIRQHQERGAVRYQWGDIYWMSLEAAGGKTYLICDCFYSIDRPIGMLIAELNPSVIGGAVQPLVSGDVQVVLENSASDALYQTGEEGSGHRRVLRKASALFDYSVEYSYREFTLRGLASSALPLLPLLLVILLMDLLLAVDAAQVIYAPIGSLVERLGKSRGLPQEQQEDDYRFLANVLEQNALREQTLSGLLRENLPRIWENVCRRIISGYGINEESFQAVLAYTARDWKTSGYHLMVFSLYKEQYAPLDSAENELALLSLRTYLQRAGGEADLYVLILYANRFVLLCHWESEGAEEALIRLLASAARQNRMTVECSRAVAIGQLQELPSAYQVARAQLNRQVYYSQSGERDAADAVDDALDGELQRCWELADSFSPGAAVESLGYLLRGVLASETQPERKDAACRHIVSAVLEYLIGKNIPTDYLAELSADFDSEERLAAFLRRVEALLNQLDTRKIGSAVQRMKDLIGECYTAPDFSLTTVSDLLGMNQSYLSALFIRQQGKGFVEYLNGYRVEMAKRLLDTTDILVKEIGFKVGFSSAQSFNRVFKKYTGMTPGQYQHARGERV